MASAVQDSVESWKAKLDKLLHEKNGVTDLLQKIEERTGVRRLYLAIGFGAILALYLMVGYGAQFVCNFVGFLYPAYASFKAIESTNKDDDTIWLTYWVVYSFFALTEFFADIFLFWIPFYWLFKCIFLIWCMTPTSYNGSQVLYTRIIRPFILRYEKKVDKFIDEASDKLQEASDVATNLASDAAADVVRKRVIDSTKGDSEN